MSTLNEKLTRPIRVKSKIKETEDACSFVLDIPSAYAKEFSYRAGQFVSLLLNINGETLSRSYSIPSSPLTDSDFCITIKRVEGGRASNYLIDKVQVGDELLVTPPAGQFFKTEHTLLTHHFLLFAAGSGITPIYSILKTLLKMSELNKVVLVYANRNEKDIIYHQELKKWQSLFPQQLKIVYVLSRPSEGWSDFQGRCDEKMIKEILHTTKFSTMVQPQAYCCGPQGFMAAVHNSLLAMGLRREQIHEESFGTSSSHIVQNTQPTAKPWTGKNAVIIGEPLSGEPEACESIRVRLSGEDIEVAPKEGKSVLDLLIDLGANPPYSCMDGACMACMAKVKSGRVYQKDPGILTDDNVDSKETLTCQAFPLSKQVVLTYDL